MGEPFVFGPVGGLDLEAPALLHFADWGKYGVGCHGSWGGRGTEEQESGATKAGQRSARYVVATPA